MNLADELERLAARPRLETSREAGAMLLNNLPLIVAALRVAETTPPDVTPNNRCDCAYCKAMLAYRALDIGDEKCGQ